MAHISAELGEEMKRRVIANGGSVGETPQPTVTPASISTPIKIAQLTAATAIPKPRLNKTETEFHEILKGRHFKVTPMGLRLELANRCTYLPDFYTLTPNDAEGQPPFITFYEVKGPHIFEDSWIKLKLAARLYPEFRFVIAQKKKGLWTETVVTP